MKSSTICGAGLVGSLLSLVLKKLGHEVKVFEKRADFSEKNLDSGRSINLILTAKGVKALQDLNLYSSIRPLCVPVYGRMMHDLEGKQIYQPYGKDKSEFNLSVSRFDLNQKLLHLAKEQGVQFFFDHELTNLHLDQKELQFKGKPSVLYQTLFSTDGAGSILRHKLSEKNKGHHETLWLGSSYKELLMPKNNPLDKNCLHIWPRGNQFLMGLPNLGGSFTMTLYLESKKYEALKSEEEILAHFKTFYPDTLALIPNLAEHFKQNPVGRLGTVFCHPWSNNEDLLLLGDAAHAIVPFFGQGMNLGFNDCSLLFELLQCKENTISQVFFDFQRLQKKNADAIAEMALENFTEMQSSVADPNFLKLKKIESEIEQTYPELYRSRYALITYSLVSYHHCKQIGHLQKEILASVSNLTEGTWDNDLTLKLIKEKLLPYYKTHKIDLLSFKF